MVSRCVDGRERDKQNISHFCWQARKIFSIIRIDKKMMMMMIRIENTKIKMMENSDDDGEEIIINCSLLLMAII